MGNGSTVVEEGSMDVVWDRSVVLLTFEVSVFGGTRILKTSGMMMNVISVEEKQADSPE